MTVETISYLRSNVGEEEGFVHGNLGGFWGNASDRGDDRHMDDEDQRKGKKKNKMALVQILSYLFWFLFHLSPFDFLTVSTVFARS